MLAQTALRVGAVFIFPSPFEDITIGHGDCLDRGADGRKDIGCIAPCGDPRLDRDRRNPVAALDKGVAGLPSNAFDQLLHADVILGSLGIDDLLGEIGIGAAAAQADRDLPVGFLIDRDGQALGRHQRGI